MYMKFLSEKLKVRNTGYLGLEVNIECFDVEYIYDFVGWGVCKQSR